ncbi:MAG: glycosyl hydrolase [Bacteroidota bacterium]
MRSILSTFAFGISFLLSVTTAKGQQISPLEKYYNSLEWRSIGPFRGGRSCAVTGVPGKPNLFYFGATGGGVWKTLDGGRSWENISDGFFGGSVGAIAVAQSDHNVIYVGGGEKTVRGNVSYGYGVWKSEDAGRTWKSMGLPDSRHISRIRIHPTDPDIVYAAVMGNLFAPSQERGLYKSVDGGETWKKTLFVNDQAGIVDLCVDPSNPRHLFASSWKVFRTPYSLESGGEGSGLWHSTDSGETWTEIIDNEGLPSGTWGISGVAVSPLNSDRVWAIIENDNGGVYGSEDGGKTWSKLNDSRALRQRAWYYTRIYADTESESTVYVVNVNYHKSTDGGKSFRSFRAPHGDHHDLWIAPEDPNRMIMGDDGGAQVTYDGGETWSTYHNQPTSQFYRVTTDNDFPYRIYAAQQDNSTIRIAHRTDGSAITEDDWEPTAGGESAHIAIDPENPNIVYGGSYGGFLTRVDHDLNTVRAINVYPDNPMGYGAEGMRYRFQWNFPIFFSAHDPNTLYTASNHLHRSTDEGQSWEIISPDLTRNDSSKLVSSGGPITQDNTGVEYYCTIFAAAESPLTEGLLWVGSDDGLVHLSRDGGANWTNITPAGMPEWMMINSIEPSPHDAGTCYIAGTKYKSGDFRPYLYKTTNFGQSWTKIVNGIPSDHFTRVLRVDRSNPDILYAGTESGMYISHNGGSQWYTMQLNLPVVPITDLAIKEDNLIAATQGRSLWIIDDLTLIHQAVEHQSAMNANHLYQPMDSWRYGGRQNKKAKGVGLNHPGGVMVHYYIPDYKEKDTISLSFLEMDGDTIKLFSTHAKDKSEKLTDVETGANSFVWNMRYPDATKFDGMVLWWGNMAGPLAVPGQYTVAMSVNGDIQTQTFSIKGNPKTGLSTADLQAQFDFVSSVNDKVTEAHEAIIEMRDLRPQLMKYKEILDGHDDVVEMIETMDSTLTHIENELYQTKNRSRQDPLNYPIKLTNKLAHLNSLTQIGDYPPTAGAIEVRDEITRRIDAELSTYYELRDEGIANLNELIKQKDAAYIKLKE